VRDGKPVIGYGFNSNGRYAPSGLLRDRFIPRLKAATPQALLDETGENFDPHRVWEVLMRNEKPGGHGERSVAVGVIDMAVWDVVAKIAGLPLYRLLADRYRAGHVDSKVFVYAAGGYYYPGQDHGKLKDEMRSYIDRGYTVVKKKIGGASLDASGRVDIWLNGAFCGAYQGPMADRDYGARRNGAPFINAQPRFGIYRDWRAETQTIYFDKIMFWNADPSEHPDWRVNPPPG